MLPFDLILFKGDDFVGKALRKLQRAKLGDEADFSHVGLFIDRSIMPQDVRLEPGVGYILESTCSGPLADGVRNINDEAFLGVQIRRLDEVGRACKGRVYHAAMSLQWRRDNVRLSDMDLHIYQHVIHSAEGIPYDGNPISLVSALMPCARCIREKTVNNDRWLFCSEMTAYILKNCGILPANVRESDVLPSDFLPNVQDDDKDNLPKIYEQARQILFTGANPEHVLEPR